MSLIGAAVTALDEALVRAEHEARHLDGALLILTKAAISNDPALVCKCFDVPDGVTDNEDGYFARLRASLHQGEVSVVLPLQVGQRYAHSIVVGELLARTGINKHRAYVDWHEMELQRLDEYCLHKVHWVKTLSIAHCRVESLPQQIGSYLKQVCGNRKWLRVCDTSDRKWVWWVWLYQNWGDVYVQVYDKQLHMLGKHITHTRTNIHITSHMYTQVVKLEFQFNQLETIPASLLQLPCLSELNLSYNKLRDLPLVPHWSPSLTTLDLSHNHLTNIPGEPRATSIHTLNLSHNKLTSVPPCVGYLFSLTSLNLSGNRGLQTLPVQIGALSKLTKLDLGDTGIEDPPKKIQAMHLECLQYLSNKLLAPKQCYQMKLVLLGNPGRGKSTLLARLQGKAPHCSKVTSGVEIVPWECKPAIGKRAMHFLIWIFSGEKSCAVHQCFLTERCMCLLVFDVTKGATEVGTLRPWLDSLALHAPDCCVLLVGTHQDKVPVDCPNMADSVLQMAAKMANEYSTRLHIMEVFGAGLKTGTEELRATIYGCAEEYCVKDEAVMGAVVPNKYLQLGKLVSQVQSEILKGERSPVMDEEEFAALASKAGVEEHEMAGATHYLLSVGAILHYDDSNCRLDKLYFLDPCWLCDAILKVVEDCEAHFFTSRGIINTSQISVLFDAERFPWKYFRQFLVLLDKFEIAMYTDSQRLFIPSVLLDTGPVDLFNKRDRYIRYILFDAQVTQSFWNRLLTMLLQSVPEIKAELPTTNPSPPTSVPDPQEGTTAVLDVKVPLKQLMYWRRGITYWNTRVMVRVESIGESQYFSREGKQGVVISASRNEEGERIMCQVVDLVTILANDWYPLMQGRARRGNGIHHFAVCSKCLELNRPLPYEFNVTDCLSLISKNRGSIECGYKPSGNHDTSLADLVPELLLKDIDTRFFISDTDLGTTSNRHTPSHPFKQPQLLDFRRRQWGTDPCGDHHLFAEFRREATLLHRCGHPCLQGVVGISAPRLMTLVVEKAPLGTLEACLLMKQKQVHRTVLHRIVAQVAAGLLYLHSNGIILHGPRTLNDIVVWSLEPDCLCHCKLGHFASATYLTPSGVRKVHLIKEGLAPEVVAKGHTSTYQNSSDIFLLGTVLYQMLTRKRRITQLKPTSIPQPDTNCYYLSLLAQWCHHHDPAQRSSTSDVIDRVCQASFQSLMQLQPVFGELMMRKACVITPAQFSEAGLPSCESEFWVFSDCNSGTKIDMHHVSSLTKVGGVFIKENSIQSVCICREHVWVAFRGTNHRGMVNLYSINGRAQVHSIDVGGDGVTCMVPYKDRVYCGTLNGCCLAFSDRAEEVNKDKRRRSNCVSEVPLDSILVVRGQLWVSHADLIHFLNPDTLEVEGYVSREGMFVGILVMSSESSLVWSAYLGWGSCLSAWSAEKGVHLYDMPMQQHLKGITSCCEQDMVITAMTPVLDTIWVGMATGHILVFHHQELLMWFHPYHKHVSVLLCCPSEGGQAMVVSGGKGELNPVKGEFPTYKMQEGPLTSGVLMLWEAFSAAMCRQVWMVQERSGTFLKNWSSVSELIREGNFKDGTWRVEESGSNGSAEENGSNGSAEENGSNGSGEEKVPAPLHNNEAIISQDRLPTAEGRLTDAPR